MKNILIISRLFFLFFVFTIFLNATLHSQCLRQKDLDKIIENPSSFFNMAVSVAGPVNRLLDKGEPGFVIKSPKGQDFFVTGGSILTDSDGNTYWQIKKDVSEVDSYGVPIEALVLIKVYPGDYVAIDGNIVVQDNLPFAIAISSIESFKPGFVSKVGANKNFSVAISMPIHPNYDWVFSQYQGTFYCEDKAKLIGDEFIPPSDGLIGSTNKNFTFKADGQGFATLKFDNLDYTNKDKPKRIGSKKLLIMIE
jgi:hypothetical protein